MATRVRISELTYLGWFPETGQLCLDRNLIVISVLSGGREKGPSFSYSLSVFGFMVRFAAVPES
jgi:hypothetical protein